MGRTFRKATEPCSDREANTWLGIDPGLSGGIALIGDRGYMEVHRMPQTEKDTWDLLARLQSTYGITYALIEWLTPLPAAVDQKLGIKRGSIATAKLMQHYGGLRMALIGLGIRFEERVPRTWRRLVGLQPHGGKNANKAKAQQLYPGIKVTHAIADALLIATAARTLWMHDMRSRPRTSAKIEDLGLRAHGMGG